MIQDVIDRLESQLKEAKLQNPERHQELLALLTELKEEINPLAEKEASQAESIAGFTRSSVHEITRDDPRPKLAELSLEALQESVREFEATHPRLVKRVNAVCTMLSNLGI